MTTNRITTAVTEAVATAGVELIIEARTALHLAKGAKLSDAIAAVVTFRREWNALDTAVDGPCDDASYRALGEALDLALHKLTLAPA